MANDHQLETSVSHIYSMSLINKQRCCEAMWQHTCSCPSSCFRHGELVRLCLYGGEGVRCRKQMKNTTRL